MAAKKKSISDEPVKKTLYTKSLTDAQMEKLDKWLDRHLWRRIRSITLALHTKGLK